MTMTPPIARALTGHTPGPWFVIPSFGKPSVCSDGGWHICKVSGERNAPNACLIAASPDLLAGYLAATDENERLREVLFTAKNMTAWATADAVFNFIDAALKEPKQ